MAIDFELIINATAVVTRVLAWGFLIFLVYRVYKKQTVRPKVWKVLYKSILNFRHGHRPD